MSVGLCYDCAEKHGLEPTRNHLWQGREGATRRAQCESCGWGLFDLYGKRVRESWWSRLLCWMGQHDWRYMDGVCRCCGARDELWLEGQEQ